jgi:hypothetical protein
MAHSDKVESNGSRSFWKKGWIFHRPDMISDPTAMDEDDSPTPSLLPIGSPFFDRSFINDNYYPRRDLLFAH